jgi:hypothetical protein
MKSDASQSRCTVSKTILPAVPQEDKAMGKASEMFTTVIKRFAQRLLPRALVVTVEGAMSGLSWRILLAISWSISSAVRARLRRSSIWWFQSYLAGVAVIEEPARRRVSSTV